jgi:hypothetical protein
MRKPRADREQTGCAETAGLSPRETEMSRLSLGLSAAGKSVGRSLPAASIDGPSAGGGFHPPTSPCFGCFKEPGGPRMTLAWAAIVSPAAEGRRFRGERVATFKHDEDGGGTRVENPFGRHRKIVEADRLPGINSAWGAFGPVGFGARGIRRHRRFWNRTGGGLA